MFSAGTWLALGLCSLGNSGSPSVLVSPVGTCLDLRSAQHHCRYMPWVAQINALEPAMQALTLEDLEAKTAQFRARLSKGATLDDLLPEAFAVVREVSSRVLRLRHFDVQMVRPHPGGCTAVQVGPDWPSVLSLLSHVQGLSLHAVPEAQRCPIGEARSESFRSPRGSSLSLSTCGTAEYRQPGRLQRVPGASCWRHLLSCLRSMLRGKAGKLLFLQSLCLTPLHVMPVACVTRRQAHSAQPLSALSFLARASTWLDCRLAAWCCTRGMWLKCGLGRVRHWWQPCQPT